MPNLLADVVMLLLPLNMVWKLQVTVRQKLALSGVFLMGGM